MKSGKEKIWLSEKWKGRMETIIVISIPKHIRLLIYKEQILLLAAGFREKQWIRFLQITTVGSL